jgi:hypothetical protein
MQFSRVRRTHRRRTGSVLASLACGWWAATVPLAAHAAEAAGAAPGAAAGAEPVPAVWQRHEVDFTYMGFTSLYSCDGLEDKLERLLKAAGARADAKVSARGCEYGRAYVARMPRAKLVFYALAPAGSVTPPAPASAAPPAKRLGRDAPKLRKEPPAPEVAVGAWREVEFRTNTPRWLEAGDCELVDQFRRDVLPKFTTRDIVGGARCIPYQQSVLDIRLKFTVLAPLPSADVGRSGGAPGTPAPVPDGAAGGDAAPPPK